MGPSPLRNEVGTWKRPDGTQSPGASMDNQVSITEYDQTDDEVSFTIKLPKPAAKGDVEIMIKTKTISVTAHGVSLLKGNWLAKCTLTIASGAWKMLVRKFR